MDHGSVIFKGLEIRYDVLPSKKFAPSARIFCCNSVVECAGCLKIAPQADFFSKSLAFTSDFTTEIISKSSFAEKNRTKTEFSV